MENDVELRKQPGCWLRSSHSLKECVICLLYTSIDNIIGVLHEKDFYAAYCRGVKRLSELKSSVLYTTETARISDLLQMCIRDSLQLLQALDIVLQILPPGAGARSGDGVGRLDQAGHQGLALHVVVV